jgi:hypothetical protein
MALICGLMNSPAQSTFAWEPLTPRGVAAFARATTSRLFLVQFIIALLVAASFAWFIYDSCFPAVWTMIRNLPATGEIRSGRLNWSGDSPQQFAEGRFLALDVDLDYSGRIHSLSDVQIEFGRETLRISSLLGYTEWAYPQGYVIPFNRTHLEPLWGAWVMELLLISGVGLAVVFMLGWGLLATIYFLPVKVLGFFTNRDLNLCQSWRLAGAALMPGAVLTAVSVLLYNFGLLNFVSLGFIFAANIVLGWIYLFLSLLFVPRLSTAPSGRNPFAPRN